MAKITVEFDTVTKEAKFAVDGAALANVQDVCFYASYDDPDEYRMNIGMVAKDDEHDLRMYTSLSAMEGVTVERGTSKRVDRQVADFFGLGK